MNLNQIISKFDIQIKAEGIKNFICISIDADLHAVVCKEIEIHYLNKGWNKVKCRSIASYTYLDLYILK